MQEDSVTQADTLQDPFMECYAAWMQQKQYSSGTGADFLASFSNTSGAQCYDRDSPCPQTCDAVCLYPSCATLCEQGLKCEDMGHHATDLYTEHTYFVLATQAWHPAVKVVCAMSAQ